MKMAKKKKKKSKKLKQATTIQAMVIPTKAENTVEDSLEAMLSNIEKAERARSTRAVAAYNRAKANGELAYKASSSIWGNKLLADTLLELAEKHFHRDNIMVGSDKYLVMLINRDLRKYTTDRLSESMFKELKRGVSNDDYNTVAYFENNPAALAFIEMYWLASFEAMKTYLIRLDNCGKSHVELQKLQFIISRRWRTIYGEAKDMEVATKTMTQEADAAKASELPSTSVAIQINVPANLAAELITTENDMLAQSKRMEKAGEDMLSNYEEME